MGKTQLALIIMIISSYVSSTNVDLASLKANTYSTEANTWKRKKKNPIACFLSPEATLNQFPCSITTNDTV